MIQIQIQVSKDANEHLQEKQYGIVTLHSVTKNESIEAMVKVEDDIKCMQTDGHEHGYWTLMSNNIILLWQKRPS